MSTETAAVAGWVDSPAGRRWTLLGWWIVMFSVTHWPDIGRYVGDSGWSIPHVDKLAHFLIYALWCFFCWRVLTTHGRRPTPAWLLTILGGGALWAAFDELSQSLVDRTPEVVDYLCDVGGIICCLALLLWWRHRTFGRP